MSQARKLFLTGGLLLALVAPLKADGLKDAHEGHIQRYDRATIIMATKEHKDYIRLSNPKVTKRGVVPVAQVTIQNMDDETQQPYELEYLFEWQNEDGFDVSSDNVWERISLGPGETMKLKSAGSTRSAYQFTLTVRTTYNFDMPTPKPKKSGFFGLGGDSTEN